MRSPTEHKRAFTLIELLVVIAIIAILIGLLFPAFKAVQTQAKQTQAKNDLTQIVNAVNAFYTDYGKYPLVSADVTYGSATIPNNDLFYTLRAVASGANANNAANPRQIVYISPPYVKNPTSPRSGISTQDVTINGIVIPAGSYFDPWMTAYQVRIDGDYDNSLANPYGNNHGAGPDPLSIGVISWSLGSDGCLGTKQPPPNNTCDGIFSNSDDVISWQ
jgi:prepilin-type N-terminal cleavage/methylation domain-containing protein